MIRATIIRFIIIFLTALAVILLLPGITMQSRATAAGWVLLIAGINAILKLFLIRFSIGCSILALGPILLVVNIMILWIASLLRLGLKVDNIWAAFWGGLVISVVSFMLDLLVQDGL